MGRYHVKSVDPDFVPSFHPGISLPRQGPEKLLIAPWSDTSITGSDFRHVARKALI